MDNHSTSSDTISPRASSSERESSPEEFPFDEQPDHALPPVKKKNRHAYFQTAESMRVLSLMEYSSWPTTTTTARATPATAGTTETTAVTPLLVSAPSSQRHTTNTSTSAPVLAACTGAPQQPHPWEWDRFTYTSFPPPSRQSQWPYQLPPTLALEPASAAAPLLSMPYRATQPPPPPPPPRPPPPPPLTHPFRTRDYPTMLPTLSPPAMYHPRSGPSTTAAAATTMSLYPAQSVKTIMARDYNTHTNKDKDHDETSKSIHPFGYFGLGIFTGCLPTHLTDSLAELIDLAEQRAATLPTNWRTDNYSLTKQDLPVLQIPGCMEIVEPISKIILEQIRRLYGRPVRMDTNQPHVLKYSTASRHTGVQLHHDRCDITANLTLSFSSDYEGGGTYYPATRCTLRCARGGFVLHPGSVIHAGTEITAGTRHLLVFFCHFE
jgi:hypothetical protein